MTRTSGAASAAFGLGLLILTATLPIQLVVAGQLDPPPWIALVSAGGSMTAGLGAVGAAYFSYQQSAQAAQTRRASLLYPLLTETRRKLSELDGAIEFLLDLDANDVAGLPLESEEGSKTHTDYVDKVIRLSDELFGNFIELEATTQTAELSDLGTIAVWAGMLGQLIQRDSVSTLSEHTSREECLAVLAGRFKRALDAIDNERRALVGVWPIVPPDS